MLPLYSSSAATEWRTFYHRAVENAQVISQKKDAKPIQELGTYINYLIYIDDQGTCF